MVFTIEINNQKVTARSGETILSVLNRNGIKIPTLCHLSGFSPTGSCRMCVVELEGVDNLVTACSYPVEEWMKIHSHSARVLKARKTLVELLLASHPDDCLYCPKLGMCELQKLSDDLNITERKYRSRKPSIIIDRSCPSIERDPSKCILCERCIRICNEVVGVGAIEIIGKGHTCAIGTVQNKGLNIHTCVKCGQCIMVCPTGALKEKQGYQRILDVLGDPGFYPVIQISPAVQASIAGDLEIKSGKESLNLIWTALQKIGFKEVYDTSFGADLNSVEVAGELEKRIANKEKSPLFSACCPSWVLYIHQNRPDLIPQLSSSKTPMQMTSVVIQRMMNGKEDAQPGKLFKVAVMPCTSKKYEAEKMNTNEGEKSADVVLTTRELVRIIRHFGVDFSSLEPNPTGVSYGLRGTSGRLFGVSGGVMESVARTLSYKLNGTELSQPKISDARGLKSCKVITLKQGKNPIRMVAVNGLANAIELLSDIDTGKETFHFVEVMACPFGCINGGGQRIGGDEKQLKARMKTLYDTDEEDIIRAPHKNPAVQTFYEKIKKAGQDKPESDILHNL